MHEIERQLMREGYMQLCRGMDGVINRNTYFAGKIQALVLAARESNDIRWGGMAQKTGVQASDLACVQKDNGKLTLGNFKPAFMGIEKMKKAANSSLIENERVISVADLDETKILPIPARG